MTPDRDEIKALLPGLPGYWAHIDNTSSPASWVRPIIGWAVFNDGSVTPILQGPDGEVKLFSELKKDPEIIAHVHNVVLGTDCPWDRNR